MNKENDFDEFGESFMKYNKNKAEELGLKLGEFFIYTNIDGEVKAHIIPVNGEILMNISQLAHLFDRTNEIIMTNINRLHSENNFPLDKVIITSEEGIKEQYYNIDMIISLGVSLRSFDRCKSVRCKQFRKWAIPLLSEYMKKGFIMDDERLKDEYDYFEEMKERINYIRGPEFNDYQKARKIFKLSVDCERVTQRYVRTIKWTFAREKEDTKSNHKAFKSMVEMALEYAEHNVKNRKTITMAMWEEKLYVGSLFIDDKEDSETRKKSEDLN